MFLLLARSFNQLSAIVYKHTIEKPEAILNRNHVKGLMIIECTKTTIEAIDAKAANTLI